MVTEDNSKLEITCKQESLQGYKKYIVVLTHPWCVGVVR